MPFLEDLAKGGVEGFGEAVAKAVGAFKADPTKLVELEADLTKAALTFSSSVIAAVNATMQAEAKSDHWMQWSWRPSVGFTFCAILWNNYFLYPYMARFGVIQITIPSEVWLAILTVLGVASYTRGQEKMERLK